MDILDNKVMKFDNEEQLENYLQLNSISRHRAKQFFSIPIEVLEKCSPQASICYMHILWRSNVGNVISNTALAKVLGCSTRTITNLIDELISKGCITVYIVSKTVRYIYPNYILPTVFVSSKKDIDTSINDKEPLNGGFREL